MKIDNRWRLGVSEPVSALIAAAAAALVPLPATAMEIDTGNSDVKLRWDNTFKYSNAFRLRSRDATLAPTQGNPGGVVGALDADDGDRNFGKGLISNRLDLLSEADIAYRGFGARLSVASWFDTVYRNGNDNNSSGLLGPGSNTANSNRGFDEFTAGTRTLHGGKAEVLDAFVYGKFDAGDTSTTVRLGQHALVWGESLFLGANAIAGAQNASDLIKAQSVPNSQVKEIVMPVPQLSMQTVLTPGISIGAYYQFRYERSRFPGVGSYFAVGDTGPEGYDYAYGATGPSPVDTQPVKDSGQGGLRLSLKAGETDIGLYVLRFHSKAFQYYPRLGLTPAGPAPTGFTFATQEKIMAYGVSASRTFGDVNVAGEASIRRNTDLSSTRGADVSALSPFPVPQSNGTDNTAYAVGNTGHVNVSALWALPRTALWREANFMGELAWNRMLSCTRHCDALTATGTRDAAQIAAVLTPTYNQVLPGLNVSVPIGVNYTPKGSRSLALGSGPSGPDGGGSFNIGLQGLYLDTWRFGLTYTHYFGKANVFLVSRAPGTLDYSYGQTLKDRDFLALSLSRTF